MCLFLNPQIDARKWRHLVANIVSLHLMGVYCIVTSVTPKFHMFWFDTLMAIAKYDPSHS